MDACPDISEPIDIADLQGWNILDTLTQPADMLSQKLRKA